MIAFFIYSITQIEWTVQLGTEYCIQAVYFTGQAKNTFTFNVGSSSCLAIDTNGAGITYNGSALSCSNGPVCGNTVVVASTSGFISMCEIELEVTGSSGPTTVAPTTQRATTVVPPEEFQYDQKGMLF